MAGDAHGMRAAGLVWPCVAIHQEPGAVMRRLIPWLLILALMSGLAYLGYLARLTYTGYCHAADKYLTDEEKIRVALGDLLKKYPPSVVRKPLRENVWSISAPENPIYYRDVDEFLSLNPDCCKFTPPAVFRESDGRFTLVERLTGVATNLIEVKYWVRYLDKGNTMRAIKTTGYLYITSCGTPGDPPYIP
jgi:hypothetical protein